MTVSQSKELVMTRITKKPEERRNEILNTAQRLFIENGYLETSVSEIVKEIGVAQGTFYYYFKTKEEVINAIIDRYIDEIINDFELCLAHKDWDFLRKMENLASAEIKINLRTLNYLHRIKSVDIEIRILSIMVKKIVPYYRTLIEEGIKSGSCNTDYPHETAELIIAASHILFDPGLFHRTREEFDRLVACWIDSLEKSLSMGKGSFHPLMNVMSGAYKRL